MVRPGAYPGEAETGHRDGFANQDIGTESARVRVRQGMISGSCGGTLHPAWTIAAARRLSGARRRARASFRHGRRPGQGRRPPRGDARRASRSAAAPGSSTSMTTEHAAAANGKTTGLLRVFASGEGNQAAARGYAGQRSASSRRATRSSITTDKKTEELRITLGGRQRQATYSVDPPTPPHPDLHPAQGRPSARRHRSDERLRSPDRRHRRSDARA